MLKNELIQALARKTGLTQKQVGSVLDGLAEVLSQQLVDAQEITLNNVGKFSVGHREARAGRNPQTGEAIEIAAHNVVKFKADKKIRDAVNS